MFPIDERGGGGEGGEDHDWDHDDSDQVLKIRNVWDGRESFFFESKEMWESFALFSLFERNFFSNDRGCYTPVSSRSTQVSLLEASVAHVRTPLSLIVKSSSSFSMNVIATTGEQ